MNTEILNSIKAIQEAKLAVANAGADKKLTDDERERLDLLFIHLNNLERALINELRDEMIDALTNDAKPLQQLIEGMESSIEKLQMVAAKVQSAAEKVEALIKIMGIAAKVGLI